MGKETNAERLASIRENVEAGRTICEPADIDWLIEQASLFQTLLEENQLLYGKLNMFSDILEEGREEI